MSSQCSTDAYASSSHAPLLCRRYGAIDEPRLTPGSGPHALRANCHHCGHFLQWCSALSPAARAAKRREVQLQAMAQRAPSQMQLSYLQALGYAGPPPQTILEASTRIDALLQQKEV